MTSALEGWEPQEPKLTWLDPKFKNMIAVPIGGDEKTATDWDVYLVDWEDFGWYPAWLQAKQIRARGGATLILWKEDKRGPYPVPTRFREPQITTMLEKDFDTNFDCERNKMLPPSWRFY